MSLGRSSACLIDSNILVYMYDDYAADRQVRAIQAYQHLLDDNRTALSTQCLAECFNAVTRKLKEPVPVDIAGDLVGKIADSAIVYSVTLDVVRSAMAAAASHQMAMWDALIWAVAFRNNIPIILTEDRQSRPVIEGVRYVNPFAADFDIETL